MTEPPLVSDDEAPIEPYRYIFDWNILHLLTPVRGCPALAVWFLDGQFRRRSPGPERERGGARKVEHLRSPVIQEQVGYQGSSICRLASRVPGQSSSAPRASRLIAQLSGLEPSHVEQNHPHRLKPAQHPVERRLVGEDAAQDGDGSVMVKVGAEAKVAEPFGVARVEMPLHANFVA